MSQRLQFSSKAAKLPNHLQSLAMWSAAGCGSAVTLYAVPLGRGSGDLGRPRSFSTRKICFKRTTDRVRIVCRSFGLETRVNGISSSLLVASTSPFITCWGNNFVFNYLQGLVNEVELMVPLLSIIFWLTTVFWAYWWSKRLLWFCFNSGENGLKPTEAFLFVWTSILLPAHILKDEGTSPSPSLQAWHILEWEEHLLSVA